jgi:hypothetical protein
MEQSLRYNTGKPQWSLVDFKSLEPLVRVMEYGAQKYARENWKKGLDLNQILESLSRHLFALMSGEQIDPESGCEHIGNIMANAMFYKYHYDKQLLTPGLIDPRICAPLTPDECLSEHDIEWFQANEQAKRIYKEYNEKTRKEES